jgi:hypothetical protein
VAVRAHAVAELGTGTLLDVPLERAPGLPISASTGLVMKSSIPASIAVGLPRQSHPDAVLYTDRVVTDRYLSDNVLQGASGQAATLTFAARES